MQICSAIRPAIGPAITPALLSAFCGSKAARPFADTVASWFDTGAPGRFVPTFRDWQTSGALWVNETTPVTALEQAVWLNLDRSRNLRRGDEMISNGNFAAGGTGWTVVNQDATHVVTIGAGSLRYQSDTVSPVLTVTGTLLFPFVFGRIYEVITDVVSATGVGLKTDRFAGNLIGPSPGIQRRVFQCISNGVFNLYRDSANIDITIRSISVREILGAHRIQPTSTSRPVLTARKNILVNSMLQGGGSAPTGWAFSFGTGVSAPAGSNGVNTVYRQTANAERPFLQALTPFAMVGDGAVTMAAEVGEIYSGSIAGTQLLVLNTAVVGTYQYYINGLPVSQSAPIPKNSKLEMTFTYTGANGTGLARVGLGTSGPATGDLEFSRPMLTRGTRDLAGRYQWTGLTSTTPSDYDAVGFPVGLRYDGVDDCMYTSSPIDYSAVDKATAVYAMRKDSDTNAATVFEHGANAGTVGCFGLFAPDVNATARLAAYARGTGGTTVVSVDTAAPAPRAAVLTQIVDMAAPSNTLRVDGVVKQNNTNPLGGSLTSQVSYEGSRNNASLRLNGVICGEMQIGNLRTADELGYVEINFAKNLSEAV